MDMEIGTRVKIVGITDEDADLNGLTGALSRKFFTKDNPFKVFGEVGVWLDSVPQGGKCQAINVMWSEVEPIGDAPHSNGVKV